MKKIIGFVMAIMMMIIAAGCGASNSGDAITVISREDGSGTRGAFVELFGIEVKNEAGDKVDMTIATADQTNSTGVMLTSVSQNTSAIGYVSLGSLNDSVKAVRIDGVDASIENVKNGTYIAARPFNIATRSDLSEAASDFISFILSSDGQSVIEEKGYVAVSDAGAYVKGTAKGKISIAGSSSVAPVMEKLIEAYNKINGNVEIELQTSDSTMGISSVTEGICDIGMASRDLKQAELEAGLTVTVIAKDGIAVIVNKDNAVSALTSEQVMKIYTGEITTWNELN